VQQAQPFDGPERAVGGQEQPDRVLQGVLRYGRQRPAGQHPQGGHDQPGQYRRDGRDRDVTGIEAEGDHDEHHLDALQEHALERDYEAEPVQPEPVPLAGGAGGPRLFVELLRLVVACLEPGAAQDRLAQPLQAEDEQQHPDHQLQRRTRQPGGQRVTNDGGEPAKRHQRGEGAGQRGAPAPGQPHRQHDGQRLDELDEGRDERGGHQPPDGVLDQPV